MGQSASGGVSNALTSVRVLFLDVDNRLAYQYTEAILSKYPEITCVLATSDTLSHEINRADVFVTVNAPVTKGVIARAALLKMICQFGNDLSDIDLRAAAAANIAVTRIPSSNAGIAESCAESAVSLALTLLRAADSAAPSASVHLGKNLCGMTAIVLGNGGIGKRLTFLLQAMGSDASCVNPDNNDYLEELRNADIIFLCCGVKKRTKNMVNLEFLQNTKNGAYIVSISKSQLLNLDDLKEVLSSKERKIGGIALDNRHMATQHSILSDSLVYVSPSVPDATEITYKCISQMVAGNIVHALRGEPLEDVVAGTEREEAIDGEAVSKVSDEASEAIGK